MYKPVQTCSSTYDNNNYSLCAWVCSDTGAGRMKMDSAFSKREIEKTSCKTFIKLGFLFQMNQTTELHIVEYIWKKKLVLLYW